MPYCIPTGSGFHAGINESACVVSVSSFDCDAVLRYIQQSISSWQKHSRSRPGSVLTTLPLAVVFPDHLHFSSFGCSSLSEG